MRKQPINNNLRSTVLDNFKVSSFRLNSVENEEQSSNKNTAKNTQRGSKDINEISLTPSPKQSSLSAKKNLVYYNNDFGQKGFFINGVNYFSESLLMNQAAQVLQDCYSVKGDYFYLKKDEIIKIRSKIGDFVEVKYQKFIGYFPARFFKLVRG